MIRVKFQDGRVITGWRALPWVSMGLLIALPQIIVALLVVLVSLPEYLIRKWLAMRTIRK